MFVILLLVTTKNLSLSYPGYEVKPTRFSHDPNKVIFNFSSYVLTEYEKVYFARVLGFLCHLKRLSMLTLLHNLNYYIGTL